MKNSSKILKRRNVKKITFSCFTVLLEGGDEIRSLSMVFCDKIKHPQTVTFLLQITMAEYQQNSIEANATSIGILASSRVQNSSVGCSIAQLG